MLAFTVAAQPAVAAPVAAVAAAAPAKPAAAAPASAPKASPIAAPEVSSAGRYNRNETRVQMSPLKLRAAQRQKDTQNSAAMLSTFQECDLGNLIALREELGEAFEKAHGVKLGFMSTFLKASALALQKVPAVNSCTLLLAVSSFTSSWLLTLCSSFQSWTWTRRKSCTTTLRISTSPLRRNAAS